MNLKIQNPNNFRKLKIRKICLYHVMFICLFFSVVCLIVFLYVYLFRVKVSQLNQNRSNLKIAFKHFGGKNSANSQLTQTNLFFIQLPKVVKGMHSNC
jgi:hypothetical protein